MTPRVYITRRIPDPALTRIQAAGEIEVWEDRMPPAYDVLVERVRGVEGIVTMLTDRIDGPLLDAAGPQLKVVSQMAVGYDNIDVKAARERGIPVGHTPGVLTEATADLAFALLMASARRISEGVEYIRAGAWQTWEPMTLLGADISGATLGIIGLGRIGTAVAKRAAGFDMRVLAHSRTPDESKAASVHATWVEFETLLRESDFVSLHVPLNANTRHLINRETLAMMKRSAILINTTRGPVVDQRALYDALTAGVIRGAALDVTDPEPIPLDDPILTLPNALIIPHLGSATVKTRDRMAALAADNLLAGLAGQPLPHAVPAP